MRNFVERDWTLAQEVIFEKPRGISRSRQVCSREDIKFRAPTPFAKEVVVGKDTGRATLILAVRV